MHAIKKKHGLFCNKIAWTEKKNVESYEILMSTIHKVFYEINQCNNTKIASSPVKRFWSKNFWLGEVIKNSVFFSLFCFVFVFFIFFLCLFVFFIFYNKKFDAFQLRISVLMTVVGLKCIIIYCKCNSLSFILNALSSI